MLLIMCYLCHRCLSDDEFKKQLNIIFYNMCNCDDVRRITDSFYYTQICMILYACAGINGEECRDLATSIMKMYIEAYKNTGKIIKGEGGILEINVDVLDDILIWCLNYTPDSLFISGNKCIWPYYDVRNAIEEFHYKHHPIKYAVKETYNTIINNSLHFIVGGVVLGLSTRLFVNWYMNK